MGRGVLLLLVLINNGCCGGWWEESWVHVHTCNGRGTTGHAGRWRTHCRWRHSGDTRWRTNRGWHARTRHSRDSRWWTPGRQCRWRLRHWRWSQARWRSTETRWGNIRRQPVRSRGNTAARWHHVRWSVANRRCGNTSWWCRRCHRWLWLLRLCLGRRWSRLGLRFELDQILLGGRRDNRILALDRLLWQLVHDSFHAGLAANADTAKSFALAVGAVFVEFNFNKVGHPDALY